MVRHWFAFSTFSVAVAVSSFGVGCGGSKPPEAKAPETSAVPTAQSSSHTSDAQSHSQTNVSIAEDIQKICGISTNDAYFAFDSAQLRTADVKPLNSVATCFVSGPLKGRKVKVLGHTDPRGDGDYNMALGQSRADSVGSYLGRKGIDTPHRLTTSRGALDATGSDESGWQKDRRVDLLLGE